MSPDELEKYIDRMLHSLPDMRAPRTLEARVRAAIEARAAIPWWHKSWSNWPQSVRAFFILICGAAAVLLVAAGAGLPTTVDGAQLGHVFAPVAAFTRPLVGLGRGLGDIIAAVARSLPVWWLYGAAAIVVSLYVMLVGVGAAAYRTLWTSR